MFMSWFQARFARLRQPDSVSRSCRLFRLYEDPERQPFGETPASKQPKLLVMSPAALLRNAKWRVPAVKVKA